MDSRSTFVPRPYRRAWWLRGAHLQTIGGWLLRPRGGIGFHRERLDTPDGDFVDLDFVTPASGDGARGRAGEESAATPLVLVLHGLEGGSRALPALQALREIAARGMQGIAMNFRSCSGEPNRTARFYHAGDTEDLTLVFEWLTRRFPQSPLGLLGYSLGGNVLLKYLGERGANAAGRIRAAAAVSVPYDLDAGARQLERGMGRIYGAHFLRSLRRKYREKRHLVGNRCDVGRVATSRTIREFDDRATAPLHGFRDVEHYYTSSSSAAFLARIRVPTLLLHSADDPFLPSEAMPYAQAHANPHLIPCFTEHGGHMGFIGGPHPWAIEYWAEAEAARFLAHHLATGGRAHASAARAVGPAV
jgi:uncharacterized protein